MKKIYESPKTVEVRIACQKMIAASSLQVFDEEITSADMLSRDTDGFDFSDDSFDFSEEEFGF